MWVEVTPGHPRSEDMDVFGECPCPFSAGRVVWCAKSVDSEIWAHLVILVYNFRRPGPLKRKKGEFSLPNLVKPSISQRHLTMAQVLWGTSWDILWDSLDRPQCGRC